MEQVRPEPSQPDADAEAVLLAVMLEHATDGICLVDRAGIVLACTPAVERMLGIPAGSLRGANGLELLYPDDVPPAVSALAGVQSAGLDEYRGYRFRRQDDSYVTVEVLATETPVPVAGAPDGTLVLTVREVTEYHRAQEELERSRERRELVAAIAAGFVDALDTEIDAAVERALALITRHTHADRAHVFRSAPDGASMHRTHKWAESDDLFAELAGLPVSTDLYPNWRARLLSQEAVVVDDVDTIDPAWTVEAAVMRASGVSALLAVPLVREGAVVGFLALDVFGRANHWSPDDVQVMRVATDVIGSALARRDAAEASVATESKFRALVQNSSDALIVIDDQGVINQPPIGRILFGYTPDELFGRNALELVHPEDMDFAVSELVKAVEDPDYQATNAMRIRHADGHWIPIELVARSHFDDPAINGVVMNVRDHSERDAFASALRTSEERLRTLIENLPGAVYRCRATPPYHDEFVSDIIEELTGYTPEQFVSGEVVFDQLMPSEHRERTDAELAEAIAGRRPFEIEFPIRHRDGSIRWLAEHGRATYDDEGRPEYLEGFILDVTSRVEAVNENRESETKLANLIDNVPGVVFRCESTPPYRDLFISDTIEELTGYPSSAFGRELEFYDLMPAEHQESVDAEIRDRTAEGASYRVEYEVLHRDGARRWIEERGQAILNPDGTTRWIDGVMMDLTDRKALEQQLAHDAAHDPLTGLPNRTMLLEHLETMLARSGRTGSHTAVLFVDLDRFKLVNDAMGHTAGDELLVHFTRRLSSVLRESDLAARTGGDEFVIVCADLAHPEEAETIAQRVAAVLADPFTVRGRAVFVTASIGIAFAEPDAQGGDVLQSADAAAYRAKDRGRNRYEVFDDALRAATAAALEIETDLHRALERHELFLRYQPVVDMATGQMLGAEALVRWLHPHRGLLGPDQFLPAAEASGLVVAVGREVLELATGAMADVPAELLPHVAINLSPRELAQRDVVERIRDALDANLVDPNRLCVEITENAVLDDLDVTIATLDSIRELGACLAIDDFGTGYSSLSYLRRLPVDTVKIDRTFTSELCSEGANITIIAGIIGLARGLGLDVIAEGVETEEQAHTLLELGCTRAQGYLYSPPIALDDLLRLRHRQDARSDARH